MASTFQGDIEGISEAQLAFIGDTLAKLGHEGKNINVQSVGKAGDNYVANVKRIILKKDDGDEFRMIAKLAPQNEMLRQATNSVLMFRTEHVMYIEVLPKLLQLQISANVPEEERLRFAACYGSSSEAPHEAILLEDLKVSNFKMLDRFEPLPEDCVKSVLKDLSILHSLSYVLKHKEPETYGALTGQFIDVWSMMDAMEEIKMRFTMLEMGIIQLMESEKHKEVLKGSVNDALSLAAKLSKSDSGCKQNIIQQGDCWTNNLMFTFEDGKVKKSIMIDYQQAKESNPVCDIFFLIFNCTDYESRKEHFNEWIDYYHAELEKSLSNFDLQVDNFLSRNQLDADMKRYGKVIFGLLVIFAGVTTMKSEDAAKMMESMLKMQAGDSQAVTESANLSNFDMKHVLMMKTRIEGIIESHLELGLL